jgi:hypothetical protein
MSGRPAARRLRWISVAASHADSISSPRSRMLRARNRAIAAQQTGAVSGDRTPPRSGCDAWPGAGRLGQTASCPYQSTSPTFFSNAKDARITSTHARTRHKGFALSIRRNVYQAHDTHGTVANSAQRSRYPQMHGNNGMTTRSSNEHTYADQMALFLGLLAKRGHRDTSGQFLSLLSE